MTPKQKSAIIGMILGDAYLQKTGKKNARLRLEQSLKQKEYLEWKVKLLQKYFSGKVQILERFHPKWNKVYYYSRAQSYSSSELGIIQRLFYNESNKIIPTNFSALFKDTLGLAIWFMDDGYYYHRDRIAYIYIPQYDEDSLSNLLFALQKNFNLQPILKVKKKGLVLIFGVKETIKLIELIKKFIIPSMHYKLPLDPVSTDRNFN